MGIKKWIGHSDFSNDSVGANVSASTTLNGLPSKSLEPTVTAQGKESTFGTNAIIKTFYEGKSNGCSVNWVETPPKQLKPKISKAYDRVAIKVYKVKDPDQPTISGRTPLKIHIIEIQSPILVSTLKNVVEHEGVFLEAHETAIFTAPFKPLYFSYDKIVALYKQAADGTVLKEHLNLLTGLMTELFGDMMAQLKHLKESRLITFKLAWTYFLRDSILYCGGEDCDRLVRVDDTQYQDDGRGQTCLSVNSRHIIFNGATFEWAITSLKIPKFAGNMPITSLPDYPLSFHTDPSSVKTKLRARGEKALDYQGLRYCEYVGTGIFDRERKRHNVSSNWNNVFVWF